MAREPAEPLRLDYLIRAGAGITPGKLADLVAYPLDPLSADLAALPDLVPTFTVAGGKPKHDPDHRLAR